MHPVDGGLAMASRYWPRDQCFVRNDVKRDEIYAGSFGSVSLRLWGNKRGSESFNEWSRDLFYTTIYTSLTIHSPSKVFL